MNRILNATKLDFYAGKSTLKMTVILLLLAVVIGALAKGPIYTMIFMMVFAVTSCGTIFSTHEKSHSDKLYGILPLKKSEMIMGRYLFALIIGAVYAVISGITGLGNVEDHGCKFGFFLLLDHAHAGVYLFQFRRGHRLPDVP